MQYKTHRLSSWVRQKNNGCVPRRIRRPKSVLSDVERALTQIRRKVDLFDVIEEQNSRVYKTRVRHLI
jgi:hypothetical protein